MTDAEIIKALECCTNTHLYTCDDCPFNKKCESDENVLRYALDLINRKNAEIERLKTDNKSFANIIKNNFLEKAGFDIDPLAEIKAEAIKEFAERLKEHKYQTSDWSHGEHPFVVEESDIDNLVEEMAGDTE